MRPRGSFATFGGRRKAKKSDSGSCHAANVIDGTTDATGERGRRHTSRNQTVRSRIRKYEARKSGSCHAAIVVHETDESSTTKDDKERRHGRRNQRTRVRVTLSLSFTEPDDDGEDDTTPNWRYTRLAPVIWWAPAGERSR